MTPFDSANSTPWESSPHPDGHAARTAAPLNRCARREAPATADKACRNRASTPPRRLLLGFIIILAFAASYVQLAFVHRHLPPDTNENNGKEPTFFAFHVDPYGTTSEDFHLYVVRAKRILDRGWTDSPLTKDLERGHNFAAPLQVLLGMVAATTGGRPLPYSIFIGCVFAFGWGTLYFAARRFLPASVPTESIVLALLMAMLFESARFMFVHPEGAASSWPALRNMRMSTLSWTTPLMLSCILAVTSLWQDRSRFKSACAIAALLLLALAAADNWAFGMAWFEAGIVTAILAAQFIWNRLQHRSRSANLLGTLIFLSAVLVVTYAAHRSLVGGIAGDAALRSGFGPAWQNVQGDPGLVADFVTNWLLPQGLIVLALLLLLPLVRCFHAEPAGKSRWLVEVRKRPDVTRLFAAIGLLTTLTMCLLNVVLSRGGMEPYVRFQFYWRVDPCLLFFLLLSGFECIRSVAAAIGRHHPRLRVQWGTVMLLALALMFVYHQRRIQRFIYQNVSREYYLTRDLETLRPWLEKFDREHKHYSLATPSVELNYLCAYWTNADLMLPSGFPYHTLASNADIERQTVDLLRLYHTSPDAWRRFTTMLPGVHFCEWWHHSRVEAAGIGYMYHLFHRALMLDSERCPEWRQRTVDQIAGELDASPDRPLRQPDIVLIDTISRELGTPDLENYKLGFRAGKIEAWVRSDLDEGVPGSGELPLALIKTADARAAAGSRASDNAAAESSEDRPRRGWRWKRRSGRWD